MTKEEDRQFEAGVWIGGVIVFLIMGVIMVVITDNIYEERNDLAQSICDQEYNMDYDSYDNGVLKCKPKEVRVEVQYDGIIVEIGK